MEIEQQKTYKELQKSVDQLLAMYLLEKHVQTLPSQLTVFELIRWAYQKSQQKEIRHA
jgi:hypothetical protein